MTITKRHLEDKLELFKLAGFTNTGNGWDYSIPQAWFDQLSKMGLAKGGGHPYMADCTGTFPVIRHVGECYPILLDHRSQANSEIFDEMFNKQYTEGDTPEAIACEKAFYHTFISDEIARAEVDAGFADINMLQRFFMEGVNYSFPAYEALRSAAQTFVARVEKGEVLSRKSYKMFQDALANEKKEEKFLLQSAWCNKRPGTKPFCFVIRTKEYACSGTNYVVHMMTDDGGFHHGCYTDDASYALRNFLERCEINQVQPLPLVNKN